MGVISILNTFGHSKLKKAIMKKVEAIIRKSKFSSVKKDCDKQNVTCFTCVLIQDVASSFTVLRFRARMFNNGFHGT